MSSLRRDKEAVPLLLSAFVLLFFAFLSMLMLEQAVDSKKQEGFTLGAFSFLAQNLSIGLPGSISGNISTEGTKIKKVTPTETPSPTPTATPTPAEETSTKVKINPTTGVIKIIEETASGERTVLKKQTGEAQLQKWLSKNDGENVKISIKLPGEQIEMKTNSNGDIVVKKEMPDGTTSAIKDSNEVARIERSMEQENLSVKTDDGLTLSLRKGSLIAIKTYVRTTFDSDTNTMAIQTSKGIQQTNLIPEKAVNILIAQNIISSGSKPKEIELHDGVDEPVFFVNGGKDKKIFGLLPVKIQKVIVLSAQTGQVLEEEKSFPDQIFDLFSF